MDKISTCLWFDTQAEEAAQFYIDVFGEGSMGRTFRYTDTGEETHGQKPGSIMTVEFRIHDHDFVGLNGGPEFTPNPSTSFMVNYDPSQGGTKDQLDAAWQKLSDGGKVLMPLEKYSFSEHYGWVQDKYGISWQLLLTDPDGEPRPFIIPALLFVDDNCGKAEEAGNFYVSVFKNSKKGTVAYYTAGMEPDKEGTMMFSDFILEGRWFAAMDSAQGGGHNFNEAISFVINCDDQAEIDYYWGKLSAVPESEICGWVKDKYGVSWQIIPKKFYELLEGDGAQASRVMSAVLKMSKIEITELEAAAKG